MKTIFFSIVALTLVAGCVYAQDPGLRDSLIVGDATGEPGQSVTIPIWGVADDSVMYFHMPLTWYAPEGGVFPIDGPVYHYPFLDDDMYDTVYYNPNLWSIFGFAHEDTFFMSPGQRSLMMEIRFIIDPGSPSQVVDVDTTHDPINGSLAFGLVGGTTEFRPAFLPGHIYVISTAVNEKGPMPNGFSLRQNYPNPFNPSTRIDFALPSRLRVSLVIFDILGNRVRALADEVMEAGNHVVIWDGKNEDGKGVSSGIYFYRLSTKEFSDVKRMMLVR